MRTLCLLLVLISLLSILCGCEKEDAESTKAEEKSVAKIDRYFMYVEDRKLYVLDAKLETSKELSTEISVLGVNNALVCEDSAVMIAHVENSETGEGGLLYWDGESTNAEYFGDKTELARISRDGKTVIYTETVNDRENLYRYDVTADARKMLVENVRSVAVSEDASEIFVVCNNAHNQHGTLYFIHKGDPVQTIAEVFPANVSVSQDCSAVAYLKSDDKSTDGAYLYPCYLWTRSGGEKKLPFEASYLQVFTEDEIYYQQIVDTEGYRAKHCYYNGKESRVLTKEGMPHGHKAGNHMYYYQAAGPEGVLDKFYLAYKGESTEVNIKACYIKGYFAFLSPDDKCLYGWSDGQMYCAELDAGGKITESQHEGPEDYSPRNATFCGESILYATENGIYLDGVKVADDCDSKVLAVSGEALAYYRKGKLHYYKSGKTTTYDSEDDVETFYPTQGDKVASLEDGSVVLHREKEDRAFFGETVTQLARVYSWDCPELSNVAMATERKGAWFQRSFGSLVWRW